MSAFLGRSTDILQRDSTAVSKWDCLGKIKRWTHYSHHPGSLTSHCFQTKSSKCQKEEKKPPAAFSKFELNFQALESQIHKISWNMTNMLKQQYFFPPCCSSTWCLSQNPAEVQQNKSRQMIPLVYVFLDLIPKWYLKVHPVQNMTSMNKSRAWMCD